MKVIEYFRKHYYLNDEDIECCYRKKKTKCTILYRYYRFFKGERYVVFIEDIRRKKIPFVIGKITNENDEIQVVNDDYVKLCILAEMCNKLGK